MSSLLLKRFLILSTLWAVPVLAAPAKVVDPDNTPAPVVTTKLPPRPFTWAPLKFDLPKSVQVFEGSAVNVDGEPLHAWYASIDYQDYGLQLRSILSKSQTGRETTSSMAKQVGALLAVNGAYFDMVKVPSPSYSVVISQGQTLAQAVTSQVRDKKTVPVLRGAFGVRADRSFDISWIGYPDGETYAYPNPLPNTPGAPAEPATKTYPVGGHPWNATEAVGGGPVVLKRGIVSVTDAAELFGPSHSVKRHPRTAVGFTAEGRLILFLVDGRQPTHSNGMSLVELGQAMKDLGCTEALNLDGGGSSAFVVRDQVLNKPSDGTERKVTSILALVPKKQFR